MSWIDKLRGLFRGQQQVTWTWHGPGAAEVLGMSASQVWRTQPYLRTVVTFMARNVAQLGLQTFERVGETDRRRVRDSNLAKLIKTPNPNTTSYELVFGIVADLALYDQAYLSLVKSTRTESGWELHRIPVPWVTPMDGDAFSYGTYRVQAPGATAWVDVLAPDMITFHGWSPDSERDGSSPVDALKSILAEQIQAVRYREAVWKRGGKVSAVITRPAGNRWSDEARKSFRADWNSKFTDAGMGGTEVGGTPILEDGMSLNKIDFSAHEQQFVEGAKLALTTVASVFHVNPTMIGFLDNANYSNVREFRKMLYGDTLGPVIAQIEDRLNTFLVPRLDSGEVYLEFNIAEKLQGNFEDQMNAISRAVGAPVMVRNEARARLNLPAIEGGDELITPLNLVTGAQTAPSDGTTPVPAGPVAVETDETDEPIDPPKAIQSSGPSLHLQIGKAS